MTMDQQELAQRLSTMGPVDRMIERLAERMGSRADAATVFGTPVERAGVTVIPVARVRYMIGGGGGSGHGQDGQGEGEGGGGGGGLSATPMGYIEVAGGEAIFKRILDPAGLWPLVLASGLAGWLILRGLRALKG
jgi:uncharacterized spore protein YtfJ